MSLEQKPILLADDSEDDEVLFKRVLRLSGLVNPVILVRDGEEAIAYLAGEGRYKDREKHPMPKVLMLDLKMPKKSGFDVLEWLKGRPELQELLVVVLTSSERIEDLQRSYKMGADTFLTKPCQVEDMKNLVSGFSGYWSGCS
jgi:CheY-like chemotaxis protein